MNHSNVHLIIVLAAESDTANFPKVVQADTLGEVGILGTVLLRVSSGTILQIFTEIGSHSTDMEQKVSWQFFSETLH